MDATKFLWQILSVHHVGGLSIFFFPFFFFVSKFLFFAIFFIVFVNTGPYGSKKCQTLVLLQFYPMREKLYDKKQSWGNMKLYIYWRSDKMKVLWHFEIFVSTGPYGVGNFKALLLLQFSSDLRQTL